MASQVTGRKRIPNREKLSAEDDALSQIAREAEARLAAKRAARAEAREIRMKELERQQKEISDDDERMSVGSRGSLRGIHTDLCSSTSSLPSARFHNGRVEERSDFLEKGSRTASTLSAATLASLGGGSSRRGSCDTSLSADTEASIREMKDSLVEVEEKYRKAMVSNAHLDNEKTNLMYQVDTLRETLMELEELLCETRREFEEKTRECERECHAHSVLKFQFEEMKETLKQSEELLSVLERQKEHSDIIHDEREALRDEVSQLRDALKKHGIVLVSEVTANGKVADGAIDGHADVETASRLNHNAHTPTVSADSMLDRGPEQQINPTTETEITRNSGETTTVLEAMTKEHIGADRLNEETREMQDIAVCTPQKEEIAREGTTGSAAVKRKCSPADVVSSVVRSCLKERSDGPLTLPGGIKASVLQTTGVHVSEEAVEPESPERKVSSATGLAGNMMENSQTHKLDSVQAQSEDSAVQTTSCPSEEEVWTVSTEVEKETVISEGIQTLNSPQGQTAPDESEMAALLKNVTCAEEHSENDTSECADGRFNSSQAKSPPVNVQELVNKESMSEDEGHVGSSPETSQNMLMQPLKPNSQITSEMAEYEPESWQSIGIIAAMKTSQDLMFDPTVDICNPTEGNGAQSHQETVVEFECGQEDALSIPVEYKGFAFLLDSCQEVAACDAAVLELDEVSAHSSEASKELTVAVRGLRVENETRPFFKTKLEVKSIFSCFVS